MSKTMSIITFGVLGLAVYSVLYLVPWVYMRSVRFDAAAWKAAEGKEFQNPVRQPMADYLVCRQQLLGTSRAEVIETLGKPYYSYDDDPSEDILVYRIGGERRLISLNNEYLHVHVQQGRVVKAFVTSY